MELDATYNPEVKIVNGKLFFGKKEVSFDDAISYQKDGTLNRQYAIRVNDGETFDDGRVFWELVTTLDLHSNGLIWLCGFRIDWNQTPMKSFPTGYYKSFDDIENILNNFCPDTIGKEWIYVNDQVPDPDPIDWGNLDDDDF